MTKTTPLDVTFCALALSSVLFSVGLIPADIAGTVFVGGTGVFIIAGLLKGYRMIKPN